jgi:hypothetical protein
VGVVPPDQLAAAGLEHHHTFAAAVFMKLATTAKLAVFIMNSNGIHAPT